MSQNSCKALISIKLHVQFRAILMSQKIPVELLCQLNPLLGSKQFNVTQHLWSFNVNEIPYSVHRNLIFPKDT